MKTRRTLQPPEAGMIGYVAGVIDTEGCISVYKNRLKTGHVIRLTMRVANTNRACIEMIQSVLKVGTITRQPPRDERKATWRWFCSKPAEMKAVLRAIKPYLQVLEFDAHCALRFLDLPPDSPELAKYHRAIGRGKGRPGPRAAAVGDARLVKTAEGRMCHKVGLDR